MDNKEVMFVGFDIYNFIKGICERILSNSSNMTDDEDKAYRLGVDNTLSLLEQTLSEAIVDEDNAYQNIAVHIPNLNTMTEFSTIEELEECINK